MKSIKEFFKNPLFQMISKILSWTILSLLILVASFLVYYVVSAKIYETKGEKFEPQFSLYTIISASMEPTIKVYDVVFDSKVNPDNIMVGDVITFISSSSLTDGMTITHRVVDIIETDSGKKFRTKGDNNVSQDSALVDSSKILGKVMFKLPQLGRVQFLLQSKGGWLFALLIPAIGVVIYDVIKVIRLSSVKQKINESLNKTDVNPELKAKEAELKDRLKKKFVGVAPVEPIMHTVKNNNAEKVVDVDNKVEEVKEKIKSDKKKNKKVVKISNDKKIAKKAKDNIKENIETFDDLVKEDVEEPIKLNDNVNLNNDDNIKDDSTKVMNIELDEEKKNEASNEIETKLENKEEVPVEETKEQQDIDLMREKFNIDIHSVIKNIEKLDDDSFELPKENIELPKIKK